MQRIRLYHRSFFDSATLPKHRLLGLQRILLTNRPKLHRRHVLKVIIVHWSVRTHHHALLVRIAEPSIVDGTRLILLHDVLQLLVTLIIGIIHHILIMLFAFVQEYGIDAAKLRRVARFVGVLPFLVIA